VSREKIADVFKAIGQPSITYVKRDSGKLEVDLSNGLDERGQLCLITGPSKTGKTTLYTEVLHRRNEIPLIVRCDRTTKINQIWRMALETVDFSRTISRVSEKLNSLEGEAEAEATLGWSWLAGITTKVRGKSSRQNTEAEVRENIIAESSPDHLIPILKNTNYVLVIEDFHYLGDDVKITLFQQWKRFTDNEISVIVLGTTHRAVDIATSNKDLLGRISQIDVGHWSVNDLSLIVSQGISYLKCTISSDLIRLIASEAVGLPIVVQQACLTLFQNEKINFVDIARSKKLSFRIGHVEQSLHVVSQTKYTQFETHYTTLIRGPREKARKFRTYELVLACFTLNPIQFFLSRKEIDERMSRLQLESNEIPPPASLNSTFGALRKFQEKRNFQLLEWRPIEEILYIIEPSFLFYVRWRAKNTEQSPKQLDLFEKLLISLADKSGSNNYISSKLGL